MHQGIRVSLSMCVCVELGQKNSANDNLKCLCVELSLT